MAGHSPWRNIKHKKDEKPSEAQDAPKPGTREVFLDDLRKFVPKDEPKKK